jgi:hypothetical protein
MFGMPGETLKTVRESAQLMGLIAAKLRVPVEVIFRNSDPSYAIPLVGTPLYEYGKQLGLIGQTVDEEEKYLELTSNVAIGKRYYINFNGAPLSEVLFWDMLFLLESTRNYVELMKGKTEDLEKKNKYIKKVEEKGRNPHAKLQYQKVQAMGRSGIVDVSINQYFITSFLRDKVVCNTKIARLPRIIIDPIVRSLLMFEYIVQKYFFKMQHNLHTIINQRANSTMRIPEEELDPSRFNPKDISLRSIVKKRMLELDRSDQEITISKLTAGY